MYRVRVVQAGKTKSKSVQVVSRGGHQIKVFKHIGSSKTAEGILALKQEALAWIASHENQTPLFPDVSKPPLTLPVDFSRLVNLGVKSRLIYRLYRQAALDFNFSPKLSSLIIDLVVVRLIEPSSKSQAIKLLTDDYGVVHGERTMRSHLNSLSGQKTTIETAAISYAKSRSDFDCSMVFYDVTTLYFETFESNQEVKQCGMSKEHKNNQPQIVIGLIVTPDGFPLEFKMYQGNKAECKTLLPTIESFCQRHKIKSITVVADAAMISQDNVDQLIFAGHSYIVGARLANLTKKLIEKISQTLNQTDQSSTRIRTGKGDLICQFSQVRYNKDKHEAEKQLERARANLTRPSQSIKRLKYLSIPKTTKPTINQKLFEKTKLLWGIKGYYTNQKQLTDQDVIEKYHNLWKIEKNFRMAKTDLQTRPIYHYQTKTIMAHLLICFMALCVGKHLEKTTGLSLKKLNYILRRIAEVEIQDKLTNEIQIIPQKLSTIESDILEKFNFAY